MQRPQSSYRRKGSEETAPHRARGWSVSMNNPMAINQMAFSGYQLRCSCMQQKYHPGYRKYIPIRDFLDFHKELTTAEAFSCSKEQIFGPWFLLC